MLGAGVWYARRHGGGASPARLTRQLDRPRVPAVRQRTDDVALGLRRTRRTNRPRTLRAVLMRQLASPRRLVQIAWRLLLRRHTRPLASDGHMVGDRANRAARRRIRRARLASALLVCVVTASAQAQRPVSRLDAVAAAVTRGPLVAFIAADTARAAADYRTAGVRFQPNLQASFTQASPQYHVIGELPLDGTLLRNRRLAVAGAVQRAARGQFAFNRASIAFDADTAYTRALAAASRAALSRRNAADADSLRRIAEARRDAGDASELDVQLATIVAGQQANVAAVDSIAAISALLDVQTLIGEPADTLRIRLADSLGVPVIAAPSPSIGAPLRVTSAAASVAAAEAQVALEKRSRFGTPSLTAGFEQGDPTGAQTQRLPTVGVAFPMPFPGPQCWRRTGSGGGAGACTCSPGGRHARIAAPDRSRDPGSNGCRGAR